MKSPEVYIGVSPARELLEETERAIPRDEMAYRQQWAVTAAEMVLSAAGIAFETRAPSRNKRNSIGVSGYHAYEVRKSNPILMGELDEKGWDGSTHRFVRVDTRSYRDFDRRLPFVPHYLLGEQAFSNEPRYIGGSIAIVELTGTEDRPPVYVDRGGDVYYKGAYTSIPAYGSKIHPSSVFEMESLEAFTPSIRSIAEIQGLTLPPQ